MCVGLIESSTLWLTELTPSQHSFVLTFQSLADRDYYLDTDPAHQAFKAEVGTKLAGACVMDFEAGVF